MTGKTVVVTGASTGIGAAAARQLHALGAEVVVVGRSPDKTAAVAREVGTEPLTADFARLSDVRRLADDLLARCPRIDVLANNAGGIWPQRITTPDGHEQTFQVNHLATYLLTRLLRDRLLASRAQVVTTSSSAHNSGRLDFDDLDGQRRRYRSVIAYGTSKVENILFTRELARREPGLRATSFHPGAVATEFGRDSRLIGLLYRTALQRVLRTPDQGADTLVWLAAGHGGGGGPVANGAVADARGADGGYYVSRRPGKVSAQGRDDELARRLWERSAELVGLPA